MVDFSPSIEQQKQFYNCEANIWVCRGVAIMNRQIVYVFTDAC